MVHKKTTKKQKEQYAADALTGLSILATVFTFGAASEGLAASITFAASLAGSSAVDAGAVAGAATAIATATNVANYSLSIVTSKQSHSKLGEATAGLGLIASAIPGLGIVSKGLTYAEDAGNITSNVAKGFVKGLEVVSKSNIVNVSGLAAGIASSGISIYSAGKTISSGNTEGYLSLAYNIVGLAATYYGISGTYLEPKAPASEPLLGSEPEPNTASEPLLGSESEPNTDSGENSPNDSTKSTASQNPLQKWKNLNSLEKKNVIKAVALGIRAVKFGISFAPTQDFEVYRKNDDYGAWFF